MNEHHHVSNVRVVKGSLSLAVDGVHIHCELKDISPLLAGAKEEEKTTYEVSPSGYGIRWPLIDEDLSIDGLWVWCTARSPSERAHNKALNTDCHSRYAPSAAG